MLYHVLFTCRDSGFPEHTAIRRSAWVTLRDLEPEYSPDAQDYVNEADYIEAEAAWKCRQQELTVDARVGRALNGLVGITRIRDIEIVGEVETDMVIVTGNVWPLYLTEQVGVGLSTQPVAA